MARPVSRHGRYDAKVRYSPVDIKHNSPSDVDYHSQGAVDVGCTRHPLYRPLSSRSTRGHHAGEQYQPPSPSAEERGGPLFYNQECALPSSRRKSSQYSLPLDDMDGHPRRWSSGSDEGYVPSPPPRPPSAHRPRPQSSKKRPASSRKARPPPVEEDLPDVSIMRPVSSLNKFSPLPSIGDRSPTIADSQSMTSQMNDLHLASAAKTNKQSQDFEIATNTAPYEEGRKTKTNKYKENTDRFDSNTSPSSPVKYFTGQHPLPPEPSGEEDRLQLAIKLPSDGKRYHRYFSPEDYLQDLHHFAENVSQENLTDYVLACNAPRKVFSNLTQRICDVGLLDKTVLYFEERSEL